MGALMPLEEAQKRVIHLAQRLPPETLPIAKATGRYLAEDLPAKRSQPAGDMSAMDGYAICFEDREGPWTRVGECKAGSPPCPPLKPGETARIFTGALLPEGADTVVMQENVNAEGETVHLMTEASPVKGRHVRHKGGDFDVGDIVLTTGTCLDARALGQAVIAGHGELPVFSLPKIAILSTGDELVEPGQKTALHQIPASNDVMISAMLSAFPAEARNISRIADNMDMLCNALDSARDCDIIVTIGGASVGDHDLVGPAFEKLGGNIDFWKIAMKPGKPLMAGKLGDSIVLALPGNPGSAFVTATLFLLPLIRFCAGATDYMPRQQQAFTTTSLPATTRRAQFLRAKVDASGITAYDSQDSAKLSVLTAANALLCRPAHSPEQKAGTSVPYITI
ncbi:gephyrin-like molybdotransferase Glp [Parasphingorhabdus sp.]|uniref:molybdopterin molybdotransferase MoeA n=1 Tax=Parasphingorhabdus sp. TaxID=2709688 RepID=UPI003263B796